MGWELASSLSLPCWDCQTSPYFFRRRYCTAGLGGMEAGSRHLCSGSKSMRPLTLFFGLELSARSCLLHSPLMCQRPLTHSVILLFFFFFPFSFFPFFFCFEHINIYWQHLTKIDISDIGFQEVSLRVPQSEVVVVQKQQQNWIQVQALEKSH